MHCILWLSVVEDNVLVLREVHKFPFLLWNKNDMTDFKTKTNEQKKKWNQTFFSAYKCEWVSELGGELALLCREQLAASREPWIFPIIAEPAGASNPHSLSSSISFLNSWGLLTVSLGWGWSFGGIWSTSVCWVSVGSITNLNSLHKLCTVVLEWSWGKPYYPRWKQTLGA